MDFNDFFGLLGEMMTSIPETNTGYSDCTGSSSVSSAEVDSLEECQQKCLMASDCNTINYCSTSTGCGSTTTFNYKWCMVKKCTGDDYQIATAYGSPYYDIYTKMNGIFYILHATLSITLIIAISLK